MPGETETHTLGYTPKRDLCVFLCREKEEGTLYPIWYPAPCLIVKGIHGLFLVFSPSGRSSFPMRWHTKKGSHHTTYMYYFDRQHTNLQLDHRGSHLASTSEHTLVNSAPLGLSLSEVAAKCFLIVIFRVFLGLPRFPPPATAKLQLLHGDPNSSFPHLAVLFCLGCFP